MSCLCCRFERFSFSNVIWIPCLLCPRLVFNFHQAVDGIQEQQRQQQEGKKYNFEIDHKLLVCYNKLFQIEIIIKINVFICFSVWEPLKKASVLHTHPKLLATGCGSVTSSPISRFSRISEFTQPRPPIKHLPLFSVAGS